MADDTPLFRDEALNAQRDQWLGTILLVPRVSQTVLTAVAGGLALALVALLWFGTFTRTAHIAGWLVPEGGLVQVFTPQAGVVTDVQVKEGMEVEAGAPLFVLNAEVQSATRGATGLEVARLLLERRDNLRAAADRRRQQSAIETRALRDRLRTAEAELGQLEENIRLQRRRTQLATTSESRERQLRRQGFQTDEGLQQSEERRIEQYARLGELQRNLLTLRRDMLGLKEQLDATPLRTAADLAAIDREITTVEQQLAEAESRREMVVPAPSAGVVTTLQAERGGRAMPGVPMLNLVRKGSALEAHLFTSSKSVGFLRPGQRVRVRYQAYPYQKFGHYEGVLRSISGNAINPKDLPTQVAGLTNLVGSADPVYRLVVRLDQQSVTAYGAPVPLQPGMQLDADVAIEQRRLIEWVLDPLFSMTGKWTRCASWID